ncbi:SDR family NAD(P)-dependent oxidoreductase [Chromobacterium violaceum]|uniref:SDR family NAD(P)-dependent oxidoreductase n=1 Tax=Chromobacterium violaceum TaxID=536 RepID=UPI0005D32411|nr:SDR family NAD(P)-dependent oxidoreductase [Chromobacterium violaceum]KJH66471.1 polyketide synthase [Chromobacterium violaceum]
MSSQEFQAILVALQNRQISETEARLRLQRLKTQSDGEKPATAPQDARVEIAVIGMAGQFPGAEDVGAFWRNLAAGVDGVTELGERYLDSDRSYASQRQPGKTYCKWGGALETRDDFDPLFFNISPRDAESMNPHQRLILQEGWKALEDAGYNPRSLKDCQVGVFIGAEPTGYFHETFIGASDAIIASRLSYFLDLKGPALVVNTGCSSSAAAIHLACDSLRNGETGMALAGGVFATLGEPSLISLSQMDMLSPSGRCHTFDERSDGIVLAEAVGMVALKRLPDALADGDPIHGVICASGMNQDGASNGITAPNGQAQEKLISELYDRCGIDPRRIGYVEAHGTGTPLGDPVEVGALARAFRRFTTDTGYCALGSAKAHIGHASAAAGVVSLIKILLSMRHRRLPGLLNFERPNPRLPLEGSAFYIAQEDQAWSGRGGPLMAALNSFGHSGTNVHMVIREADAAAVSAAVPGTPQLLSLSARTADSLAQYARRLRLAVAEPGASLADLAHTLRIGRPALSHRLVFLCRSKDELAGQLDNWLEGYPPEHCWHGAGDGGQGEPIDLPADAAGLPRLAHAWAAGGLADWAEFGRRHSPSARRIHAPTYPFARQNFWIPPELRGAGGGEAAPISVGRLHPFLSQNVSDLSCQRYITVFDGEEFFLKQHVVGGHRIFPGVGHLEMARAAVELAAGKPPSLGNIVWLRPLILDRRPRQVEVTLTPEDDGRVRFEISSREYDSASGAATGEPELHSQGMASFDVTPAASGIDLEALRSRTDGGTLSAEQCYRAYREMTFEHGPAYQGLRSIRLGRGEVLAELALPPCRQGSLDDYLLHPSLMDSALQAAIALSLGADVALAGHARDGLPSANRPTLPFALDALRVSGHLSERMWARVSCADRSQSDGAAGLQRLDIELFNEAGELCVAMLGFSSRVLGDAEASASEDLAAETLLFRPRWEDEAVVRQTIGGSISRLVLLSGFASEVVEDTRRQLAERDPSCRCEALAETLDDPAADYHRSALALLERIRVLLRQDGGKRLLQLAVHNPSGERMTGGLAAMLRSLRQEAPDVACQLIELDETAALAERLDENAGADTVEIRYGAGRRQTLRWQRCPEADLAVGAPWKDGGVYLITGGLGGLGRIFARAIDGDVKGAVLVLTGRSNADPAPLERLDAGDNRIEYRRLDASDADATKRLVDAVLSEHGRLDGVLHCAGVVRDSLLINKRDDEMEQVLAAKVAGTRNLDLATASLPLDFMILFSSGAGAVGNVGQADYAAANAFVDRYAAYRAGLARQGRRGGLSLAINWPLWKEGGMKVDAETERGMALSAGIAAMPTNTGIHALRQCVAQGEAQTLVMHGDPVRIKALMTGENNKPAPVANASASAQGDALLAEALRRGLAEQVARQMKIPAGDIRADAEFSQYGYDSISLTALAGELKRQWKLELAPTVFFEYPTITRFAAYLARAHADRLAGVFMPPSAVPSAQGAGRPEAQRWRTMADTASGAKPGRLPSATLSMGDDIAVIGVSGRFPMADDVEAFFRNLRDGKDGISEVPADRWDWREYYGDPHRQPNKTNVKWGGFIRGVDHFDPLFFGISPREAQLMDPQQRLLMTYVWLALEDAGYAASTLAGSDAGIFVGTGVTGYSSLIAKSGVPIEGYSATAMVPSVGPNRMSFLLDLHGPSEPVETACSSSLVAIHRAVQAMRAGDCSMAIAGGVNTLIAPEAQISFNKAGMLALDGRSKTFSAKADGYARGEGVGMIVLKRRVQAEADGDHIYALIRATAENHGGKANSLTAPNPRAQAELLKSAYRQAGVDPRSVGYIEAHGTGTPLGDPIEINGLKTAFGELAEEMGIASLGRGYCGVGSVKSNVGHLELAAGIAGVIKALLQLKHRTLFPSLHCEEINPYIELEDSPFYIVRESQPWPAARDAQGKELPRRAGVSSFGFGGANAHILLEEYHPPERLDGPADYGARPILLSAKTPERLREYARRLSAFLADRPDEARRNPLPYLDDLAYTLQTGREPMEERLALLSDSLDDLQRQLADFAAGGEAAYRGRADGGQTMSLFREDEDMAAALSAWMEKRKLRKLAELWCQGLEIDWRRLHRGGHQSRRLSLPGYPFAEERYWVTDLVAVRPDMPVAGGAWLHPMLERNTSDFYSQRFSSRWQGEESWFSDHQVDGRKLMPGVGYLEMARAAIVQSWGADRTAAGALQFDNVVWLAPYAPGPEHDELHVELSLDGDRVSFRIYSQADGVETEHCKGGAAVASPQQPAALYLEALRAEAWRRTLDAAELYPMFERMAIHYGASHRGVRQLSLGEGRLLARLELDAGLLRGNWMLHPGMLDSAVQASIGLLLQDGAPGQTRLPFAMERLIIHRGCQPAMWAYIRLGRGSPGGAVQRVDIDLCDENGQVAVSIRGFSSRPLGGASAAPNFAAELPAGLSLLAPRWEAFSGESAPPPPMPTVAIGGTHAVRDWLASRHPQLRALPELADSVDGIASQLDACGPFQRLVWAPPPALASMENQHLLEGRDQRVLGLFRLAKALIRLGYDKQPLSLSLVFSGSIAAGNGEQAAPELAACHGLAGSLAKEYEHWQIELLDLPADGQPLPAGVPEPELRAECLAWREGEWFRQRLLPLAARTGGESRYREGGVYLVIGGAGGIGEVWTRHAMRRCRAQVVWLGRRAADDKIRSKLAALAETGRACGAPAPVYIQADATDAAQLEQARRQIVEAFGPIHGLVHSALVLDDARLEQMDEARFVAALDAKMAASVRMAEAFSPERNPELDFALFFSSMISFSRAAGQANYAAGCAFADAFASRLGQRWPCPVKVINWGYWGSVGIVASPAHRARMAELGLGSIEPDEGMAALDVLLASSLPQLGLVKLLEPMALPGVDGRRLLDCYPGAAEDCASADWRTAVDRLGPPPSHHASAGDMNQLLLRLVCVSMADLAGGEQLTESVVCSHPAVSANLAVQPFYRRWLRESLRLLAQAGHIDGEGRLREAQPDTAGLWREWERASEAWRRDSGLNAQLRLVETCARALSGILRGEMSATEIMFPGGSMSLVEDIYKNNRVVDYFNAALCEAAAEIVRRRAEAGETVRILEIGAGTGGTTAGLIARLQSWSGHIAEYCYTDVSQAFLRHAEQRFAPQAPYLRTAIFDAGQACAAQGIAADRYDLVIATNVLHATPDLRRSLANAKAALKRGGLLLLNEISDRSMFTHLTFGLLEGWWLYEDPSLRIEGCPGLRPERWRALLAEQGFEGIAFPAAASHRLGQQIIVAASDGVACQPRAAVKDAIIEAVMPIEKPTSAAEPADAGLEAQCRRLLAETLSKLVNIPVERLRGDVGFDRYGVDSILQISLIQSLEQAAGELSRTILFEYNTIEQLAGHLAAERGEALRKHFGGAETRPEQAKTAPVVAERKPRLAAAPPAETSMRDSQAAEAASAGIDASDIAIIGVAGRYPMADELDVFWDKLRTGSNCVGEAPARRWAGSLTGAEPWAAEKRYGGFLSGVEEFDKVLFGLSGEEAGHLSPELRLMLEVSWRAFEDAGYSRDAIASLQRRDPAGVGVFIGSMYHQSPWAESSLERAAIKSNVTDWQVPNRISHYFDLKGPSLAVNSACSSSMTAIHLACRSLLQNDCAMALAGGVNLILDPSKYRTLQLANYLGSGELSRGFGQGDGMIPGEGAGMVLLKPLAAALADGDRILGVIKSSGANHGGGRQRYSAPDIAQQARLISESIRRAGLRPEQINYVEAAANGSELGDPIEVAALKKAFGGVAPASCGLGTVKSNIGHLEAASGISQLTKVLLQLRHGELAPSINAEPLNPHIRLEGSAFRLQEKASPWPALPDGFGGAQPRRCLINSFGAGGSYASLVVEEAPAQPQRRPVEGGAQLLLFAAASRKSLLDNLARLRIFFAGNPHLALADLAYSLALRDRRLGHRAAVLASSLDEACDRLAALLAGKPLPDGCWMSAAGGVEPGDAESVKGSPADIAAAYCLGAEYGAVDLYPAGGNRTPLPGYVFERAATAADAPIPQPSFESQLYRRIVSGELDAEQFERLITNI